MLYTYLLLLSKMTTSSYVTCYRTNLGLCSIKGYRFYCIRDLTAGEFLVGCFIILFAAMAVVGSDDAKYKCRLSLSLLEKAEIELNEKEKWRDRDIQALRDMVILHKGLTSSIILYIASTHSAYQSFGHGTI